MLSAMFVMSCLSPLFSIYVRDVLRSGTFLYGVVSSAMGVGLIVGTQVVNRFAHISRKAIVLDGLAISAAGVALLAIFGVVYAAVGTTFLMGFGIAFVIVSSQTLMQQGTPPEMMGRVSSSFMSVFSLAQVFGMLLSGYLAVWLGIRQVFLACALALLAMAGAGVFRQAAPPPIEPAVQ
jgi:MFS family permease